MEEAAIPEMLFDFYAELPMTAPADSRITRGILSLQKIDELTYMAAETDDFFGDVAPLRHDRHLLMQTQRVEHHAVRQFPDPIR